jgi:hypothetical protein
MIFYKIDLVETEDRLLEQQDLLKEFVLKVNNQMEDIEVKFECITKMDADSKSNDENLLNKYLFYDSSITSISLSFNFPISRIQNNPIKNHFEVDFLRIDT